jgi:predicted nucleic acid-binding protein
MTERELPADASCLIYLARIEGFQRAARCVRVLLIGPAVWREAVEDGERYGCEDAQRIRDAEHSGFVGRVELDTEIETLASNLATTWRLGQGESEALALAGDSGWAVVDDGRAARVAVALGIEPVSTLFLPALGALPELQPAEAIRFLRELAVVMSARAEAVFEVEDFIRRSE